LRVRERCGCSGVRATIDWVKPSPRDVTAASAPSAGGSAHSCSPAVRVRRVRLGDVSSQARRHSARATRLREATTAAHGNGDLDWCRTQLLDLVVAADADDEGQRTRLLSPLFESLDAEALPATRPSCSRGAACRVGRLLPTFGAGAGDGIRTRDLLLGKQMLCQLRYSRSQLPKSIRSRPVAPLRRHVKPAKNAAQRSAPRPASCPRRASRE
jgi:hypothetical protein